MMRLVFLVLLGLSWAHPAWACQCDTVPSEELMRSSTLAFTGRAISLDSSTTPARMTFARGVIYKGVELMKPVIALNHSEGDASCVAEVEVGKDYLVVARGSYDSGYVTDFCMMNQANNDIERQKLMYFFSLQIIAGSGVQGAIGYEMKDLEALRNYIKVLLDSMNPEPALLMSQRAAEVSRNSRIDVATMGEAYLQLYLPKLALEKFDDVLEVQSTNQEAWSGRYRALAQLGRWSEVPGERVNLSRLLLRGGEIGGDFKFANFSKSWLEHVSGENRNLTGADFTQSLLAHVNFSGATLTGANFSKARLRAVNLRGVDLSGVNFSGSILDTVDLTGSKLDGADFSGADLQKLDLHGIDITILKTDAATKLPGK
jgi:uncharacterized protein YjbI with pentapeptide repeats